MGDERTMTYGQENGPFETSVHLPEEHYRAALKRMVKYCHDAVFVDHEGNFLLAQRKPGKSPSGTWCIGGQVSTFMPLTDSLRETLQRETALSIAPERFSYIGQNRYWFSGDANIGITHDAVVEIYVVQLTQEELSEIRLDPQEYVVGSLRPYSLSEIQEIPEPLAQKVFSDLWRRYTQRRTTKA